MATPVRETPNYQETPPSDGNLLSFIQGTSPPGMEIIDHIEHRRSRIVTPTDVVITETSSDSFYMPIDRGVTFVTDHLKIPHTAAIFVRNSWGLMVDELSNGDKREFPEDQYSVEITAPIKIYINFSSKFTISVERDRIVIEFPSKKQISLGGRSHHKIPAGSITVTSDTDTLMEAVSHLGSSIKTWSCERSYPTLRGHPPTFELGDELHIPEYIDKPDTGVRIEIPPTISNLLIVSPLAFYLGADIVPGNKPCLRTTSGFSHRLKTNTRDIEEEVERVLKQCFFLDCITRTEGYYKVELDERNRIESSVDLDFASLYDAPLETQIERYLSVRFQSIEPEIPKWKLTAHVEPLPEYIEYLPFLIQDLAIIRTAEGEHITPAEIGSKAIEEFMGMEDDFRRSTTADTRSSSTDDIVDTLIDPVKVDSLEHAWVGEDVPVGASKSLLDAYINRLEKEPSSENIEITVICNDPSMSSEIDIVNRVYGSRAELSFDVDVYNQLTVDQLQSTLRKDIDFLHYVGHIDNRGFECDNGRLDVSELDSIGVDAFFLNACTSYRQGKALIESGSIAGVVTLNEVVNSGAEIVGKSLAKLLNQGFPIRAALSIAQTQSIMGNQYIVLGDGNADIAQPASGTALLLGIDDLNGNPHLKIETFPTGDRNIGSMFVPYLEGYEVFHLCSGTIGPFAVDVETIQDYLDIENFPILRNRTLYWSNEVDLDELIN